MRHSLDLRNLALKNDNYRQEIYRGEMQIVLLNLYPGEDIPSEIHIDNDQFIHVEYGEGIAIVGNRNYELTSGSSIVVPKGTSHHIINDTNDFLKMWTIYSPPE